MDAASSAMKTLEDSLLCPVCFGGLRCAVLGACGHATCREHAALVTECPMCRQPDAFKNPVKCRAMRTLSLAVQQEKASLVRFV